MRLKGCLASKNGKASRAKGNAALSYARVMGINTYVTPFFVHAAAINPVAAVSNARVATSNGHVARLNGNARCSNGFERRIFLAQNIVFGDGVGECCERNTRGAMQC